MLCLCFLRHVNSFLPCADIQFYTDARSLKDNIMKKNEREKADCDNAGFNRVFIVVSVVIALDPPTFIAQLMGISWGALAGAFLAPFLYGLYWKGVTRGGVWAGL